MSIFKNRFKKRTFLLIGSFAFAVVIRKDYSRTEKAEKKEVRKKRTGRGMNY